MGGAVDHLQVRRAPEGEKVGPGKVLALAPHLEQRHAVVDLGAAQEPPPGRRAAALLDAFEQAELVARRVPELPRRDAGRVPLPAARAAGAGKIAVPAEAEHRWPQMQQCPGPLAKRGSRYGAGGVRKLSPSLQCQPCGAPLRRASARARRSARSGWARQ